MHVRHKPQSFSCLLQKNGQLRYEIVAHSRWLSAMDIHPSKDNIVTAAEDCTVGVWQLPIAGAKVSSPFLGKPAVYRMVFTPVSAVAYRMAALYECMDCRVGLHHVLLLASSTMCLN